MLAALESYQYVEIYCFLNGGIDFLYLFVF